jgi:hypothetical protein
MRKEFTRGLLEKKAIDSNNQLKFDFNNKKSPKLDSESILLALAMPVSAVINTILYVTDYQDKVFEPVHKFNEYINKQVSSFINYLF